MTTILQRRRFHRHVHGLLSAALLAGSALATLPATAQDNFPERPVKLIVPFAPGGSSDSATRILAEQLGAKWKQPVVVDNKPGASGAIGALQVAKSAADGYTLLVTPVSIGTIEIFLKNPGFDRNKDLTPISQFARGDYVLSVSKDLPVKNFAEFTKYARDNPKKVFHGAFGGASMLAFEGFAQSQNIQPESVNYRGESLAMNALMAGEVQAMLSTLMAAKPFIDAGRIKAVGIPSKERSPIAPNIPTASESGIKGFNADFWFGLMAPAGTPDSIRKKIATDVAEVLARPQIQQRFQQLGLIAKSSTPDEFAQLIKHESERWVAVAKKAGIEPQ